MDLFVKNYQKKKNVGKDHNNTKTNWSATSGKVLTGCVPVTFI